jgi:hypothetical protein
MFACVRTYSGNPGLADTLTSKGEDLERAMRTAPAFIAYYLMRTPDGAITWTLCGNRAGAEASNRIASDWIRQNIPFAVPHPPQIHVGEIMITVAGRLKVGA